MKNGLVYTKTFDCAELANRELLGYAFFSEYFHAIPRLEKTTKSQAVAYENRYATQVSEAINSGQYVLLSTTFLRLAKIAATQARIRESQGGTIMFYVERLERLDSNLRTYYKNWARKHPSICVNDQRILTNPHLIEDTTSAVRRYTQGLCVPSQGDLHERNLLSDGTVVDFEAAGWNLLATDLATFLWHTLFAGNYFGPLYAKWSGAGDIRQLEMREPQILTNQNNIRIHLSQTRSDFLKQYRETFMDTLQADIHSIEADIRAALVFRLLTTFPVMNMAETDRHLSFALANTFCTRRNGTLNELLDRLSA